MVAGHFAAIAASNVASNHATKPEVFMESYEAWRCKIDQTQSIVDCKIVDTRSQQQIQFDNDHYYDGLKSFCLDLGITIVLTFVILTITALLIPEKYLENCKK